MWLRDQPRLFKCLLLIVAVFGALLCSRGQPALASCTGACAVFTFTATSSNTNGYITTIDDATINNQPNEVPLAAQVWPNNYDPHPIGVWYDPNTSHWTVFNEDLQAIPLGTSFSIFTGMPIDEPPYEAGFTTTATSGNSTGDFTLINNDVSNNNPQADVFVT